ncbi:LOW QUALITY PROTEIN: discoidin, CUB and LCCL domain-containing protein 1-like [Egretta garzetta]|uniref:LOW QUALITY PROTEIN: discoidin, CUB and LCCL domain-containing protein 1-like n=1 Tax=Egretta garzetta TaxID=188379 RepID=UPI00163C89FF|nr:LOW QUALITY PROTEIN: discoidin, CUB and LCCL domain-containing protein 1-like [Egretta garzetta]
MDAGELSRGRQRAGGFSPRWCFVPSPGDSEGSQGRAKAVPTIAFLSACARDIPLCPGGSEPGEKSLLWWVLASPRGGDDGDAAAQGDGCGHTLLTPHSGTLSSKNYPGTYPNHTACCRWRLRAPPGTSLLLAFGDVDLEPSEHCARSSLLLADPQAGTAYGPYCRNSAPATPLLVTNSSTVTVLFNSTSHRSGRGLLLSYATSQHPDLVSCLVRGTHYTQEHVSVYCPAGCKDIDGDIWGNPSQGYRDTSVLCKAAVHAGVIADELGGQVTLSREKGITLYESAFANGLHSKRGSLSEKRLIFHKACGDALEVATFNASSWWHEVDALGQDRAWAAERAALSTAGRSWAAEPSSEAAWLGLDLGTRRNVTGIITKGSSEQYDYYVTSYRRGSTLLVMLLIGGFLLLCSSLLLLAFLCRRKRKPAAELNCGITKGYPKLESRQACSLQSLQPPGSALASFPTAAAPGDLSGIHSPEALFKAALATRRHGKAPGYYSTHGEAFLPPE